MTARGRREQGRVAFRIDADPCRLVCQRFRFAPATDAAGRPTSDGMEGLSVIWRLPPG